MFFWGDMTLLHCKKFECGIFRLYTIGYRNDDTQYPPVYKIDSIPALKTANFQLYKIIKVVLKKEGWV